MIVCSLDYLFLSTILPIQTKLEKKTKMETRVNLKQVLQRRLIL